MYRFFLIDSSLWFTTLILSGYTYCSVGAGVAVTNSIMNLAPRGEECSAAAFQGAAGAIGASLDVVVMTAIVFAAGKTSIAAGFEAVGLDKQQSIAMAQAIRDGASSEEVSSQYSAPLTVAGHVNNDIKTGMIEGLHALGFAGALLITGAAAVFWVGRRGQN